MNLNIPTSKQIRAMREKMEQEKDSTKAYPCPYCKTANTYKQALVGEDTYCSSCNKRIFWTLSWESSKFSWQK